MDALWIWKGGEVGCEGGGWSGALRARFFLGGEVAGIARRNARGAARSTDPPVLHAGSDGWMARMGASWIRSGERVRGDGASRGGSLDLAEAMEAAGMESPGSRVEAGRSRRKPGTGLVSGTPVRIVGMPRLDGLSDGFCFG